MTQEPDNIPDWIKRHNREKAEEQHQADEDRHRQLEASALIREHGPEFWRQLVEHLQLNANALKELQGEELFGSVSHSNGGGEQRCYIGVDRRSVKFGPELSRMNLFYKPGGQRIRCWYQDRAFGNIELVRYRDEVRAVDDGGSPKTAQQLANALVMWMAERVRPNQSR
jgi:hypothetical protein